MPPIRVFLVDDSPLFLATATTLLGREPGVAVVGSARSGFEALEMIPLHRPSLVIMDLDMPGMNGLVTTERLKELPTPPKVVIMTIHDDPSYADLAAAARADGFVTKHQLGERLPDLLRELFVSE